VPPLWPTFHWVQWEGNHHCQQWLVGSGLSRMGSPYQSPRLREAANGLPNATSRVGRDAAAPAVPATWGSPFQPAFQPARLQEPFNGLPYPTSRVGYDAAAPAGGARQESPFPSSRQRQAFNQAASPSISRKRDGLSAPTQVSKSSINHSTRENAQYARETGLHPPPGTKQLGHTRRVNRSYYASCHSWMLPCGAALLCFLRRNWAEERDGLHRLTQLRNLRAIRSHPRRPSSAETLPFGRILYTLHLLTYI
jgi:hypothetical protein